MYPKEIKTPRLIQNGLGMVENKREEEILGVQISTRGCIICNTQKL